MKHSLRRPLAVAAAAATALAGSALLGPAATAAPNNNSSAKLQKAVSAEGIFRHLEAFQEIAEANGGNRASGSPGYDASADYVAALMERAGYVVFRQEFSFPYFEETGPASFEQDGGPEYVRDVDFGVLSYSGSGEATGLVQAVDVQIPPGAVANSSTSGCEESDFDTFDEGNIALLQRGTCPFGQKVANAEEAGAIGAIIFNEGQTGRTGLIGATLGAPAEIPVIDVPYALGSTLDGTTVTIGTSTVSEIRETENVIAETRGGRADNVVMAGAHLDSVPEGAGINDNGSGSAALLETALQLAKTKPANTLRFAWWGAEESGLLGSNYYVANLSDAELENIALYLNFDMVGSPNYMLGVYDGDGSEFGLVGPEGSDAIEALFEEHFDRVGTDSVETEFSGRSDYQAFILNGIPAGGLFTGAEGIKSAEEAALFGGVAGEAYDPCYHSACDNLLEGVERPGTVYDVAPDLVGNVSLRALEANGDAIAHAIATYAYDTSAVNGVSNPGKSHGQAKGKAGKPTPGKHDDVAS